MAKDYEGGDTMHLVTAHNEHIFYSEFLHLRDKGLVELEDWNRDVMPDLKIKLTKDFKITYPDESEQKINERVEEAIKHERGKFSLEKNKEWYDFFQKHGDYQDRDKIAVGEGAARVTMKVEEFVKKYTEGMSTEQQRVFLAHKCITRDLSRNYIAVRPRSQSLNSENAGEPNEQYKRIMADPDLKALYEYMIRVTTKVLDFDKGVLVDPTRIPLLYGVRRTNAQSLKRFFGFGAVENTDSIPISSVTGHTTYRISPPMQGLLFGGTRYIFRSKHIDETLEDYHDEVVADVNEEYGENFENYEQILAHNKNVTLERKSKTVESMDFNPFKIYNRFIQEGYNYKLRSLLDEDYSLYRSFITDVSKMYIKEGAKPQVDAAHKKATGETKYLTKSGDGSRLESLIDSYMKTQIYRSNEFKMSKTAERIIKSLRQFTSLRVMAFNIRAGVKNVSKGFIDMLSEGHARQYVDSKSIREGYAVYRGALIDILANIHSYESTNLAAAFIRDHDTLLERQNEKGVDIDRDIHNVADKLLLSADAAYIFNNAGEHAMQYGMYLAMLKHHRLINGKITSESDYIGKVAADLLEQHLPAETVNEFREFVKEQQEKNNFRAFEFRDYLSQWIVRSTILNNDKVLRGQIKEIYKKHYKSTIKSRRDEFKTHTSIYDAHQLKDGMLALKPEYKIETKDFIRFKDKVRAVNHTLHGIYNNKDAAASMRYSLGAAGWQFRKWMRANWNRWYGRRFNRIMYNETLQSFDPNAAMSVMNFAIAPIIEYRKLDKDGRASVNLFTASLRYMRNIGTMYRTLDPIEKHGVRRFAFNMIGLMTTVIGAALLAGSDDLDKWKERSKGNELLYGFLMYQMSSMTMELGEFTPIVGWKSILDRFVDSPMPITKTIGDIMELLRYASGELGDLVGIPYVNDYQSGPKKGWNKFNSQLLSLIPGAREVYSLMNIASIVDFYKMYDATGLVRFYETISSSSRESNKVKK